MLAALMKVGTALSADWLRPSRSSYHIAYSVESQNRYESDRGARSQRAVFPLMGTRFRRKPAKNPAATLGAQN